MGDNTFGLVEQTLSKQGATAVFDLLAEKYRTEKNYPMVLETWLMKIRQEMGLPLIETDSSSSPALSPEKQRAYDSAYVAAAREIGKLYLADGEIARAWPYFRAIGEPGPVAEAIERVQPGEGIDPIIQIAFEEAVNPRKGLELILAKAGICRAITCFHLYPTSTGRVDAARLLIRTLHGELSERLKATIEAEEGKQPEAASIRELVARRDWLFGEYSTYADTSHVVAVLGMALECPDRASLAMALDMAEYGMKLSENFQMIGDPPFEQPFIDHAAYFKVLLGIEVEESIAHFLQKARRNASDERGLLAAQALVGLLAQIGRYTEAIDVYQEFFGTETNPRLSCPSARELYQMARDFDGLRDFARSKGDLLAFAAAAVQSRNGR
jgi:tetratricopeptide (TPR) repeat protein